MKLICSQCGGRTKESLLSASGLWSLLGRRNTVGSLFARVSEADNHHKVTAICYWKWAECLFIASIFAAKWTKQMIRAAERNGERDSVTPCSTLSRICACYFIGVQSTECECIISWAYLAAFLSPFKHHCSPTLPASSSSDRSPLLILSVCLCLRYFSLFVTLFSIIVFFAKVYIWCDLLVRLFYLRGCHTYLHVVVH